MLLNQPTLTDFVSYRHIDHTGAYARISATVWHSALSSDRIRITPEGCLTRITVNGVSVPNPKGINLIWGCTPRTSIVDLYGYLDAGGNSIELAVTGNGDHPELVVSGVLSQWAVLVIAIFAGAALLLSLSVVLRSLSHREVPLTGALAESITLAFVPCLGVLAIWATRVNSHQGPTWFEDCIVPTLAGILLPFVLLLRLLRVQEGERRRSSRYIATVAVSLWAIAYASVCIDETGRSTFGTQALAAFGVTAGFFTHVPFLAFIERMARYPRATVVAAAAALVPYAIANYKLQLWILLSSGTLSVVRAILWICGIVTTTHAESKMNSAGALVKYSAYVSSSDFSVQIGLMCSGLEGVSIMIFLLSCAVLLDWPLFSNAKHLWLPYVLVTIAALAANCIRIAVLFMIAEALIQLLGRDAAVKATMAAFHSNAGWVVYSLTFAVVLPLVYRWAKRKASAAHIVPAR